MRIESLALPFDLADANNGGKVEVFNSETNEWESLGYDKQTGKYTFGIFIALVREDDKKLQMRMKESRLRITGVSNDTHR